MSAPLLSSASTKVLLFLSVIATSNGFRYGEFGGAYIVGPDEISEEISGSSVLDCTNSLDIKVYPESSTMSFEPDEKACKAGQVYVGTAEDGGTHLTIVPPHPKNSNPNAFRASIIDANAGKTYDIGTDANAVMMVTERLSEEYDDESDPIDADEYRYRNLLEYEETGSGRLFGTDGHRVLQVDMSQIDVMFLWTAFAECKVSNETRGCTRTDQTEANIREHIDSTIAVTNSAYINSGIKAELNLVHAYFTDYVENLTSLEPGLHDLTNDGDGKMDDAHVKRVEFGADAVALISDTNDGCGFGWVNTVPRVDLMFTNTNWNCSVTNLSFAHELGHNMGCRHDRGSEKACNIITNPGYNYGYRDPAAEFRSVMAYNCKTTDCDSPADNYCQRLPNFSSPDFSYKFMGQQFPIGDNNNDCARVHNEHREIAAALLDQPSSQPSSQPSIKPSSLPSLQPSYHPTLQPSSSLQPSSLPSLQPTTSKSGKGGKSGKSGKSVASKASRSSKANKSLV